MNNVAKHETHYNELFVKSSSTTDRNNCNSKTICYNNNESNGTAEYRSKTYYICCAVESHRNGEIIA